MGDLKTFETSIISNSEDALISKQREDVAKMRTSLLVCSTNSKLASRSLKNITVLQIFHQISRIIRYTEICDKLEAKLYSNIDSIVDNSDDQSIMTLNLLLNMQERLQKLMIESNKMLAPFLDMTAYIDSVNFDSDESDEVHTTINLDSTKREKLRNSAKQVLLELNVG